MPWTRAMIALLADALEGAGIEPTPSAIVAAFMVSILIWIVGIWAAVRFLEGL